LTIISCENLLNRSEQINNITVLCPCCKNKSLRASRVFLKNPRLNEDACRAMIAFSNLFKPDEYQPACRISLLKPRNRKLHEDVFQKMKIDMFCSLCKNVHELHVHHARWNDSLMLSWDDPQKRMHLGRPTKPAVKIGNNTIKKRRAIPLGLRYQILVRDNSTCQCCGAKATDGVQLHIDHIKPVSKGGKNIEANLQTLCSDCNLGKSDNY
jgi:hypothetical protein